MSKTRSRLRFTGELPTAAALRRYPNWEPALDEESVEGQDESTLKPSVSQRAIGHSTSVAAVTIQRQGRRPALGVLHGDFSELQNGETEAGKLYVLDGDEWRQVELYVDKGWWWPDKSEPTVDHNDFDWFPLRCETVTPSSKLRRKLQLVLMPDGSLRSGKRAARLKPIAVQRLKPGDVVFRDVGQIPARLAGEQFDISGKKRRRVGEIRQEVEWLEGRRKLKVRFVSAAEGYEGGMEKSDESWICDAGTLETIASAGRASSGSWDCSIDGTGSSKMPRYTYQSFEILFALLKPAIGKSYALPWYSPLERRVRTVWYVVEAREAAPGHRGVVAWRVASYLGGATAAHTWYDVTNYRERARRFFSRRAKRDYDRLTIYR